jgi:putative transposase
MREAFPHQGRKSLVRSNTREISHDNITGEILKGFAQIDKSKKITLVDILNRLNFDFVINKSYREIDFSYDSLFKLILFKKLKGIRFQTELVKYLEIHRRVKTQLGLKKTPDQTTVSYFINNVLTKETHEALEFIVTKIKEIAKEKGLALDFEEYVVEKKENKVEAVNKSIKLKSKEIAEFFKKKTLQMMKTKKYHNTTYFERDFIDLLVETGLKKKCAENVSNACKLIGKRVPSADTLLRDIKKHDEHEIIKNFYILQENLWTTIRRNRIFMNGVKLIIDFTDWDYNGKSTEMTINKISKSGNRIKCFRFGTMDILDTGGYYTLKAIPVHPINRKEDVLERLLLEGKKKVKIDVALVDRGFYTTECMKVFYKLNILFLMPVIRNEKIKKIESCITAPCIIKDVEMKDVKYNLIVVKKGKKQLLFATNMDLSDQKINLTKYLCDLYGKRWGIENGYKTKKEFRPMTTSRDYRIRLFFFLFTVFLYNLWILLRILVSISSGRKIKKSPITAYVFAYLFQKADYG